MHAIIIALSLLLAADTWAGSQVCAKKSSGKKSDLIMPADPNEAIAGSHGGRVWVLSGDPPSMEGEALGKWLSSRPNPSELSKKSNEDLWPATVLVVFKKKPAKGPLTIQIVDKSEPKVLVDQYSSHTSGGAFVFQETYDIDSNNGFNKGHTYIFKVGQIIKNRFTSYSTGEVALK
jgi:hypothetical protein